MFIITIRKEEDSPKTATSSYTESQEIFSQRLESIDIAALVELLNRKQAPPRKPRKDRGKKRVPNRAVEAALL